MGDKTPWASIAKISVDGKHSGTGFLVSGKYVLTALHVVADSPDCPAGRIGLLFNPGAQYEDGSKVFRTGAHIIANWSSVTEDFAVLECTKPLPESLRPLPLGSSCRQFDRCSAPGFGSAKPTGMTASGEVTSLNEPSMGGFPEIGLRLDFDELEVGGYSGSPVLVNGQVVGLLRTAIGRDGVSVGGKGFAVRIQRIDQACGGFLGCFAGPIRWPAPSPNYAPLLADRKPEFEVFERMITGNSNEQRLLLLQGTSAAGKSLLCAEFAQYARNLAVTVAEVDLKGSPDGNYVFEAIHSHLGDILYRAPLAAGPSRLIRMVDDLKSASRPLLLALDTWEKSTDDTRNWMEKHLLPQLSRMPGVVVMIAGQVVPDPGLNPAWRSHAVHRPLGPIGVDHWWEYSVRMWPKGGPSRDHVEALTIAARGSPADVSRNLVFLQQARAAGAAASAGGGVRG